VGHKTQASGHTPTHHPQLLPLEEPLVIKSDPIKYDTIQVTDIDIAFPGDLQTFTLRDGQDSFLQTDTNLTITFATGGVLEFNLKHAHWVGRKSRSIRVIAPDAKKVAE
jgi:hypothetical protein